MSGGFVAYDNSEVYIGSKWLLNEELNRYQYVLKPDSYNFDNIQFTSAETEISIIEFCDGEYISREKYEDFSMADSIKIEVKKNDSSVINQATKTKVVPTEIYTEAQINELNK